MYPNYEYRYIYRQNPKHQDEDRVCVVVEVVVSTRLLEQSAPIMCCTYVYRGLTVSLANRNARVQVAICTIQATTYAN